MARLSIVMTVKNERDLLRSNILFHKYLGVGEFHVFLDGVSDDGDKTVADLDFVVLSDSISVEQFLDSPSRRDAVANSARLQDALEKSGEHHTARQILNAYFACERASHNGIDWVISIDPDELVCTDLHSLREGQLCEFFENIDEDVEQVRFVPLEVLQRQRSYTNVFAEETFFKRREARVFRSVFDPFDGRTRRYELIPWQLFGLKLVRPKRFTWWYGHREGKCAARAGVPAVPLVHYFERLDGTDLVTQDAGHLLHYLMYDSNDFIKKYRNFEKHPNSFAYGQQVPYRKRLWRDVMKDRSFDESFLRDYYDRWIAFEGEEMKRLRGGRDSKVIEVTAVRDIFSRFDSVQPPTPDHAGDSRPGETGSLGNR